MTEIEKIGKDFVCENAEKYDNSLFAMIGDLLIQNKKMECCWNCKHNQNKLEDNEVCWNCERSCAKFGEEIIKDEWELAE